MRPARGPNTHPALPLSGRCGDRLAELAGLEPADFRDLFELTNLLDRFPGKAGKGDDFPIEEARIAALRMLVPGRLGGRPCVLLGMNVERAFGLSADLPVLVWRPRLAFRIATCPHPSGINLFWNDPSNVRRARRFWRRLAIDALASEVSPGSKSGRG
jgi:uracil-DNA glycosylase